MDGARLDGAHFSNTLRAVALNDFFRFAMIRNITRAYELSFRIIGELISNTIFAYVLLSMTSGSNISGFYFIELVIYSFVYANNGSPNFHDEY
ncbi:hypothetical protein ACLOJK_016157 [Asimina triloba]